MVGELVVLRVSDYSLDVDGQFRQFEGLPEDRGDELVGALFGEADSHGDALGLVVEVEFYHVVAVVGCLYAGVVVAVLEGEVP